MKLAEFDYRLPVDLIAKYPLRPRDKCRLMILDRVSGRLRHGIFEDMINILRPGDSLVLNNTKVVTSRLFGRRKTGGRVELFLLERNDPVSEALVRPSARIRVGERVTLEKGDEAEVLDKGKVGRLVKFNRSVDDIVSESGHVPLPPYIGRMDNESDKVDYQTVFASVEGATACPTAGLHFTETLLKKVKMKGARISYVTLHTSYGTFAPVTAEEVEAHRMHSEFFSLTEDTAAIINETKKNGNAVFAVGTTTARVLESCAQESEEGAVLKPGDGSTDLYIYPEYRFKIIDHLITNFHLPKSTLLLLVSAFAGRERVLEAYREAVERRYRFFSYGDAMLIV